MNDISTLASTSNRVLSRSNISVPQPQLGRTETKSLQTAENAEQQKETASPEEPTAERPERPTLSQLAETAKELSKQIQGFNTALQFNADEESGEMVVKVIDKDSKEVIRQIPPEKALELAKFLRDMETKNQAPVDNQGRNLESVRPKLEGLLLQAKA